MARFGRAPSLSLSRNIGSTSRFNQGSGNPAIGNPLSGLPGRPSPFASPSPWFSPGAPYPWGQGPIFTGHGVPSWKGIPSPNTSGATPTPPTPPVVQAPSLPTVQNVVNMQNAAFASGAATAASSFNTI